MTSKFCDLFTTFKLKDLTIIDSFVCPENLSLATHAAAVDTEAVEAGAADAAGEKKGDEGMTEYRLQEASMGAQVS